jgi:hypothetical protein
MSEPYSPWQNKNWQADVAILNSLHGGHICIYCNIGEAKIQQRIDRFCSFSLSLSGLISRREADSSAIFFTRRHMQCVMGECAENVGGGGGQS